MNPFDQWLPTYQPGAVAERPWWAIEPTPGMGVQMTSPPCYHWRISGPVIDGERGVIPLDYASERGRMTLITPAHIAALDAYDDAHPLPVPPPMCGQVWAENHGGIVATYQIAATVEIDRETTAMIFVSTGGRVEMQKVEPWPSPNAVLVAGPFSPWAPKGWRP